MLGRLEAIESLLDAGALVNARNQDGEIPLHISSFKGHSSAVKLLLARPAGQCHSYFQQIQGVFLHPPACFFFNILLTD